VARFLTQSTLIPVWALTRLVTLSATQIADNGLAFIPNPAKVGINGHYPRRGLAESDVHQTRTSVDIMAKVFLLANATNLAIMLKKLSNGPLIIILKRIVKKMYDCDRGPTIHFAPNTEKPTAAIFKSVQGSRLRKESDSNYVKALLYSSDVIAKNAKDSLSNIFPGLARQFVANVDVDCFFKGHHKLNN